MTKSIRTILKPFLIISYVLGLRTANLSSHSKLRFSILYIVLVWSIYYFLLTSTLISAFHKFYPIEDRILCWADIFLTLLSIVFGIYHDKKFRNCLNKLDIVDNTLLKLGIITDYDKLCKKIERLVLGWSVTVILMNCSAALFVRGEYNSNIATAMLFTFIRNYVPHTNFIDDLTTASILDYIGLKFDQVNEHLQNLTRYNTNKIKWAWKNSMIHPQQRRFSKAVSRQYITWVVVHLHLELRKISCEIDSMLGTQMTFKMASYFIWIVMDLRECLSAVLINNYVKFRIMFAILRFLWFSHAVFKFLLINYMCETVTTKASATGDLLNRLLYSTCDVKIREIISQFLLRIMYAPLRFCGIGFFQFGFKFLHKFIMSVATVLVIIIQAQANK